MKKLGYTGQQQKAEAVLDYFHGEFFGVFLRSTFEAYNNTSHRCLLCTPLSCITNSCVRGTTSPSMPGEGR